MAIGTKAKSESSEADLFDLEFSRTAEMARALSPMIPAATMNPLPVTKRGTPTALPPIKPVRPALLPAEAAVSPMLVPKMAAAELMAQAMRATVRITFGFMLNYLCGRREV